MLTTHKVQNLGLAQTNLSTLLDSYLNVRVWFKKKKEKMAFHTGLWSDIFLVSPKHRVLGSKREGEYPSKEWNHRLLEVLILKVTFKVEDKSIFLINQSAQPTVSMKMGISFQILFTDNPLCPSNMHTQIKGILIICFSIKKLSILLVPISELLFHTTV